MSFSTAATTCQPFNNVNHLTLTPRIERIAQGITQEIMHKQRSKREIVFQKKQNSRALASPAVVEFLDDSGPD